MSKVRCSNIELLRIIAMFMIPMIHINMDAGIPLNYDALINNNDSTVFRLLIESFGIVSINVFVFITGWFGLNMTSKKVMSFVYQILFYTLGIYLLFILLGKDTLTIKGVLTALINTRWDWFIKAYIVLMILSPALNVYMDSVELRTQSLVLLSFFAFSSFYGWFGGASRFFVDGYGPLSFIGLYLLAGFLRRFKNVPPIQNLWHLSSIIYLGGYILAVLGNLSLAVLLLKYKNNFGLAFSYINPLVIFGSLCLFLTFIIIDIKYNKFINWIGSSCFAVYLFHDQSNIRFYFNKIGGFIYNNTSGIYCVLLTFLFLIGIYILAILIDKARAYSWKTIWSIKEKIYNE